MPQSRHPLIEARRDQRFPGPDPAEVGRLWRFGELKPNAAGDRIVATGEIAPGALSSWQAGSMSLGAQCRDIPSSS
jgi:thioredoxin reductase (NADPH)